MSEISVLIEAGKATAAAPLGPALGPLGVNIGQIVAEVNEKTKQYAGMKVPVKIIVDPKTKAAEIKVGSPPTSALILKEANVKKGASNPPAEKVGNLSLEQVKKIAEGKLANLNAVSLKSACNEVMGVCNSMGITVEGKQAKEVIKEVKEGRHNSLFEEKAA